MSSVDSLTGASERTYECNHWQIPRGSDPCLDGTCVLRSDERHSAVDVLSGHPADRLRGICPAVEDVVVEMEGMSAIAVDTPQRTHERSHEVLVMTFVRQGRKKSEADTRLGDRPRTLGVKGSDDVSDLTDAE